MAYVDLGSSVVLEASQLQSGDIIKMSGDKYLYVKGIDPPSVFLRPATGTEVFLYRLHNIPTWLLCLGIIGMVIVLSLIVIIFVKI